MNRRELRQLYDLITASIEGDIAPEQFVHLKELLRSHPEAMRYYVDYITILSHIRASDSIDQVTDHDSFDTEFWELLSRHENIAPAIDRPPMKSRQENDVIRKIERPVEVHKIRKTSVFSLIASAAAIVFLVLFARFVPPISGVPVATLDDGIDAVWAGTNRPMCNGTRLETGNELLLLREGLATLVFDNDARIVMEGPAEFQILTSDHIKLNYGRIYAIIPPQAYGFQVTTPDAKIIDLGTEFGVQQDMSGNTELHVVSGKTSLISRIHGNRINAYVEAGGAKRLDVTTGQLEDIAYDATLFVRYIDSESQFVWRGQNSLDLADIVGGGNGLGTGKPFTALTISDIAISSKTPVDLLHYEQSANYQIRSNPFVDSLFIPKSKTLFSSQEKVFTEFPDTSGLTFGCITNGGITASSGDGWDNTLLLDGKEYGLSGSSMIHIHANTGITFDLNSIRRSIGDIRIVGFTSLCGISETARKMSTYTIPSVVDFWVLVDGVVRFKMEKVELGTGAIAINVVFNEDDRFLSLAVTDSDGSVFYDWAVFVNPKLTIDSDYKQE